MKKKKPLLWFKRYSCLNLRWTDSGGLLIGPFWAPSGTELYQRTGVNTDDNVEIGETAEQNADGLSLLFDISEEVKQFYETPVIFLTKKDFSDIVFKILCTTCGTLRRERDNHHIIELIVDYHFQWMYAVNEIEDFKCLIDTQPREKIFDAINFTIGCMGFRLRNYRRYMEQFRSGLSSTNQFSLSAELEIVDEMHAHIIKALAEKFKCFRECFDSKKFILKLKVEVDVLLNWLDKISDSLAIQLNKYVNVNKPNLTSDLTKTLQRINDEVKLLDDLKSKGDGLGTVIHTARNCLEISTVLEKISFFEDRIKCLESQNATAAVTALKYKKDFLQKRLKSLENMNTFFKRLHRTAGVPPTYALDEAHEDVFYPIIFNHALPQAERERLVTELCILWDRAVFGGLYQPLISILSATDVGREFVDDLGTYYIDESKKKYYKITDKNTLYECNAVKKFVLLTEDQDRIYFYDECGRYFLDPNTREKVYKAHDTASEYKMESSGVLLKVKEERMGVTYYYDNYGRYYSDVEGKRIYQEADSASEYENDHLGNLVRLRRQMDIFSTCPNDENVTEDFEYLKQNVGAALRECIADTIMRQPLDPIKFLSVSLIKYRDNLEQLEKRDSEKDEVDLLRKRNQAS